MKRLYIFLLAFLIHGTAALTAEVPQVHKADDKDNFKMKLTEANKKMEKAVVNGYKAVENVFVTGYKVIENGVVNGYKKIEKAFTDTFMADSSKSDALFDVKQGGNDE